MDIKKLENLIKTYTGLKNSIQIYNKYQTDRAHYDKLGCGFNLDSRFSSCAIRLSLDSWVGTFGSSGCSNMITIQDKEIFVEYFTEYLNNNMKLILKNILESMGKDIHENKEVKIEQLKKEIESISALTVL